MSITTIDARKLKPTTKIVDSASLQTSVNGIDAKIAQHESKLTSFESGLGDMKSHMSAIENSIAEHLADNSNPHNVSVLQIDAVPAIRKVNGYSLDTDISLTAADVGAMSKTDGNSMRNALAQQLAISNNLIIQHTSNSANPHGVTAGQIGACTMADVESVINRSINTLENGLNAKISTVQATTESHANNIHLAQNNINSLENASNRNEQNITTLQNNYNSLNDTVSNVQKNISDIQSQITSLNNTVLNMQKNISGIQTQILSLSSKLQSLIEAGNH